jgi:type VI secretion system secreted protein VgrG
MPRIQANRAATIETPLGEDKLLVQTLRLTEQLGRPFQIELSLLSEGDPVDPAQLIGNKVTVTLEMNDSGEEHRYLNGLVSRFVLVGAVGQMPQYMMTVVPYLWFLGRTSDCRSWQNETVPDIVQGLIKEKGFSDITASLFETYAPREYCVQYRETALNYVNRLMEEEGIYYFFEHAAGEHKLILADGPSAHENVTTLYFKKTTSGDSTDTVKDWNIEQEAQSGAYALADYDFTAPTKKMLSSNNAPLKQGMADEEMMDFPGGYTDPSEGERLARIRLEEVQSRYLVVRGRTNYRGLYAGCVFTLEDHSIESQNADWLVTSVSLEAAADEYQTGAGGGGASEGAGNYFSCSFTAIPAKTPFRSPRITPEPLITGPQTARIVGPAGEEIYTDKFGRVKAHFYWDRHDHADQTSSCWIRVAQQWAGKKWGGIVIPRIGMEVIVHYIEGDPDRPIITGCVYNGDNMPPNDLPGGGIKSGMKSNSSKGGGGSNEITLDDTKGTENMYIHAQYDQNSVIEHDQHNTIHNKRTIRVDVDDTESVGNNQSITIGKNQSLSVGVNQDETVGSNQTENVGANRTRTVGANESVSIGANRSHTVGANEAITVGVSQEITVGAAQAVTVGATQSITVGANQSTTVGAAQSNSIGADQNNDVGGSRTTSVGADDALNVAKTLAIVAGDEISITTGSASITLKKDGTITIEGKDISIEGSGDISIKASKNVTMKGQKVFHN